MMEHPENSEEYKGLTVNAGIEQPSIVNPYLKLRKKPVRKKAASAETAEEKPVNEDIFARGLCLPSDIKMTEKEQSYVIEVIKSCF